VFYQWKPSGVSDDGNDGNDSDDPNCSVFSVAELSQLQPELADLKLSCFSPDELIGWSFLHEVDAQKLYVKVVKKSSELRCQEP
jgi:hypothetical protein